MRTAYLIKIDPKKNNNKFYRMYENASGSFSVEYGRVGAKGLIRKYPIRFWEEKYDEKIKKGYEDRTSSHLFASDRVEFKPIPDENVRKLIDDIISCAKNHIEKNYTIQPDAVTASMIRQAEDILQKMSKEKSLKNVLIFRQSVAVF